VPDHITCALFGTNLTMPFTVELKGWLQVANCLLCPETFILPPGQLIRFEYNDPTEQHYYRIVAIYEEHEVNYILSRNFSAYENTIDGSQHISCLTGGLIFGDVLNVMGYIEGT